MVIEMGMGIKCALRMGGNGNDGKWEEIGTIKVISVHIYCQAIRPTH